MHALARNADMRIAVARIEETDANLREAGAAFLPEVDLNAAPLAPIGILRGPGPYRASLLRRAPEVWAIASPYSQNTWAGAGGEVLFFSRAEAEAVIRSHGCQPASAS